MPVVRAVRHVGVKSHQNGDKAADQDAHDQNGGFADDVAVAVGDGCLRAHDGTGLDGQDVSHGHEGGQTRQDLGFDIGMMFFQLENLIHCSLPHTDFFIL